MKIWDKLVFGSLIAIGAGMISSGIYYSINCLQLELAILLLVGGSILTTASSIKFFSKKDGYFQCDYKEEENIKVLADKIIAHQRDQIQQVEEEKNKPNIALEMAPIAHPQLQEARDGQVTPKGSPKNPFITNEIFKEDINLQEVHN